MSAEEKRNIQSVPASFEESLVALENDHEFLLEGGVFSKDFIHNWIELKRSTEILPLSLRPHPYEFQMYLDL